MLAEESAPRSFRPACERPPVRGPGSGLRPQGLLGRLRRTDLGADAKRCGALPLERRRVLPAGVLPASAAHPGLPVGGGRATVGRGGRPQARVAAAGRPSGRGASPPPAGRRAPSDSGDAGGRDSRSLRAPALPLAHDGGHHGAAVEPGDGSRAGTPSGRADRGPRRPGRRAVPVDRRPARPARPGHVRVRRPGV